MKKHIDILGYCYIVLGILGLILAAFIFLIISGSGLISGEQEAIWITGIVGTIISGFILIISLPGIFTGYGLLKRASWSRPVSLVLAILNILNFPFGTALAIYNFWIMMNDEVVSEFK